MTSSKLMTHMLDKSNSGLFESQYSRANGQNGNQASDRGYPSTRAISNVAATLSKEYLTAVRQKHMLPSSQRIRRDMKAQEKKFYERYLSSGYKLCECQTCDTLEMRFMIQEDRDPDDYKYMHQKYLEKKINKENITRKNGLYQNHTIIFVNKTNF